MKLRRQPRTQMKVTKAAEFLQCSPSTVRNLIKERRLQSVQRKPGTTSPVYVYEAQVKEVAEEWGIL